MPPRTSQKRGRDEIDGPSKRLRFDDSVIAAADDRAFDETVADGLETSARQTKRAVNVDGYDSDSTDEGEGVVLSRRSGANEVADEEDDMFAASGAAGKDPVEEDGDSRKEKFLELGDIEGQVFGRTATEEGGESDDEDEPVDEDEAERRSKRGMGFEMTSFNMKEEMEEGKFVEDGTFVRSRDPHDMHDRWLEGTNEREIKKARKQKERRERQEREREAKEEAEFSRGKDDLEKELVALMRKGESVLETLQRAGVALKKAGKGKARKKAPKGPAATDAGMDVDDGTDAERPTTPTAVDRITSLASTLMSLGNMDIYEETYESLLRSLRRSGFVPPDWAPPEVLQSDTSHSDVSAPDPPGTQYEYRWSPAYLASAGGQGQSGQTFGPYGRAELDAWRMAGYFGSTAAERVEVRRQGDAGWQTWTQLF